VDIKKDILWRIYLCFIGIMALGAVILGRAIYIQRVQGAYWKSMASHEHLKIIDVNAERGTIFSENGNMLSTSIPVFDVYIDFGADGLREKNGKRFHDNLDSLSIRLSGLFRDATPAAYRKILSRGYRAEDRYFPLKKKISFEQYEALKDFPLVRMGKNRSGFILEQRDNRVNPYVLLANRTIGLSRGDTSRNVGLERSYDSVLKGESGKRLVRCVAGAYIPVDGAEIDPEGGSDVVTNIDTYIQDVAENALMKMMVQNNSLHGTCIVMETRTGKIRAIANLGRRPDGSYIEDYNYGLGRRTEPGSVFKLATLISLLQDRYVDTGSIVDCEGGQKIFYGLKITDSHLGTHDITVKEAFARSSNVAFAKMADEYYHNQPMKFYDHLHALRLDVPTGIDLVGAANPYIKKPGTRYWTKTTLPFMAHGYEELITPLQLLTLYNAVANNGKMMKPYLVSAIVKTGETVQAFKPTVLIDKICSDEVLAKVRACLLAVVQEEHGTGHALETPVYTFAGKTGTAVTALDNRGYNKAHKIYQSAFMGFLPFDDPQYTIGVVIQNGDDSKLAYGGSVAGPVFREVADKIYAETIGSESLEQLAGNTPDTARVKLVGLNSDLRDIFGAMRYPFPQADLPGKWSAALFNGSRLQLQDLPVSGQPDHQVPDVTGMGLKDAVYVLENLGLKVSAKGRGKVVYQSIAQNADFHKGESINLQLN